MPSRKVIPLPLETIKNFEDNLYHRDVEQGDQFLGLKNLHQIKDAKISFEEVFESLSDGFSLYDSENRLVLWNKKFAEILSHAKDFMYPGIHFDELVRTCAQEHFEKNLIEENQREAFILEARNFHENNGTYERETPDGKCYLVSRRKSKHNYTTVIWTDITEKKQTETDLKASELLYRNLFEGSKQGIVVQKKKKILKVNQSFAQMFGLVSSEKIRTVKDLDDIVFSNDRPRIQEIRRDIFAKKYETYEYEFEGIQKNGKQIWIEAVLTPISWKGESAIQTTFFDITEKKNFHEELISQKMESLGVMARGFAMEFQKIQSAIMSQISLAKMDAYAMGIETIFGAMLEAEEFGENLEELTKQLLYLYRYGAPLKEITSVNEIITISLSKLNGSGGNVIPLKSSKTNIKIDLASHLWQIKVDKGQMIQVLQTLFHFGFNSMPFGGTLKLTVENYCNSKKSKRVPLDPGKYVKVSIEDQGDGIPEGLLDRFFDPFLKSGRVSGGLDLANAYAIVKHHQGIITVSSKLGKGTQMKLFLPAGKDE